jgi:hypothetical protein
MVGVGRPELGGDERLREGREAAPGAVPGELVAQGADARPEPIGEGMPDDRVHAVGADDEVVAAQVCRTLNRRAKARRDSLGHQSTLEELQHLQATDPREPDPIDPHPLTPVDDREVAPGLHGGHDEGVRLGIVLVQEVERALGEDEAEADGRAGRVLLDECDLRVAALAAEQIGEVEAGGPGADDHDLHAEPVGYTAARRSQGISGPIAHTPGPVPWPTLARPGVPR